MKESEVDYERNEQDLMLLRGAVKVSDKIILRRSNEKQRVQDWLLVCRGAAVAGNLRGYDLVGFIAVGEIYTAEQKLVTQIFTCDGVLIHAPVENIVV